MNRSRELLTHIYLPHFAAEAENNLRMENKKKCKENTAQQKNNSKKKKREGGGGELRSGRGELSGRR